MAFVPSLQPAKIFNNLSGIDCRRDKTHQKTRNIRLLTHKLRTEIKIAGITWTKHKHTANFLLERKGATRFIGIILKISDYAAIGGDGACVAFDSIWAGQAQQPR